MLIDYQATDLAPIILRSLLTEKREDHGGPPAD
jgi:hypothetical protein